MNRFLLKFFSSLMVASVLIFILTLVSILGTLVPQLQEQHEYLRIFPRAGFWILAFGFDDLYHGWLYWTLLTLVSISTLICTINRMGLTSARFSHRLERASAVEISSLPVRHEGGPAWEAGASPPTWREKVMEDASVLRLRTFGRAAILGGAILHIGLLAIVLGGLYDAYHGAETMIHGAEGEVVPVPPLAALQAAAASDRLRREARGIQSRNPQDPRLQQLENQIINFTAQYRAAMAKPDFSLRFKKLQVEYHPPEEQKGMIVKNWQSDFEVIENDRAVTSGSVRVNSPFHYGGFSFFQSDWRKAYRKITLQVQPVPGASLGSATALTGPIRWTAALGETTRPEWSPYPLKIVGFWSDFRIIDREYVNVSEELNNPVALVEALDEKGNTAEQSWAFPAQGGGIMPGHGGKLPIVFQVVGAEPDFMTGLQVAQYPGTNTVWLGCFLFTLGMCLTFYVFYREEWQIIRPNGKTILVVHGNRPRAELQEQLESLIAAGATPGTSRFPNAGQAL